MWACRPQKPSSSYQYTIMKYNLMGPVVCRQAHPEDSGHLDIYTFCSKANSGSQTPNYPKVNLGRIWEALEQAGSREVSVSALGALNSLGIWHDLGKYLKNMFARLLFHSSTAFFLRRRVEREQLLSVMGRSAEKKIKNLFWTSGRLLSLTCLSGPSGVFWFKS